MFSVLRRRRMNVSFFSFLASLNKEVDEVRGRNLGNNLLPIIREKLFQKSIRGEARQRVMMENSN